MADGRGALATLTALVLAVGLGCGERSPQRIKLATVPTQEAAAPTARTRVAVERRAVAVLPIVNDTGDESLDWLERGIAEILVGDLEQVPELRVLPGSRVSSILTRSSATAAKELGTGAGSLASLAEVGAELVVRGSLSHADDELAIAVELLDPATGEVAYREKVRVGKGLDNLFRILGNVSRALIAALDGDPATAAELTSSAVAFRHYSEGVALCERLLMIEADRAFAAAVEEDPSFAAAFLRMADTKRSIGDNAAALRAIARAGELRDRLSPVDLTRLEMQEARLDGDLERSAELRTELLLLAPEDIEARLDLARIFTERREVERAREEYELVLGLDPNHAMALNELGYLHARRGDLSTALKYLERYRSLTPNQPNAYDSIGDAYMMSGRLRQAAASYGRALERWPAFYTSARHLSEVYAELGDLERALEFSDRWLEHAPSPRVAAEALRSRAATLWRYGRIRDARATIDQVRAESPGDVFADWLEATMLRELGDSAGSKQIADRSFDRNRGLLEAADWDSGSIGQFLLFAVASGRDPEALLELVERARRLEPVGVQRNMFELFHGVLLLRNGLTEEAEAWLDGPEGTSITNLIGARYVGRAAMWKYLVELVEREPERRSAAGGIAGKVREAAARSGRKDLEVLARLLDVQYLARRGRDAAVDDGYRTLGMPRESDYLVIGPFENRSGFHRPYPPEAGLNLTASYPRDDHELRWRRADDGVEDGWIDLGANLGRPSWAVGYATVEVQVPDKRGERVVQVRLGSDEAVKLWVNDELVWQAFRDGDVPLDNDVLQVVLRPGWNRVLVKVTNNLLDWGFVLRITDGDGEGFDDVRFRAPGDVPVSARLDGGDRR